MKRADTFSGRIGSQVESELQGFISLLQERKVTRYLEIGARHGDTFHAVMSALPVGSFGVAVDLPGGLWGTLASPSSLNLAVVDLKAKGYEIQCVFGNSQDKEIRKVIAGHGPFDAVFIDGDHTLAGVTRDWENYRDMAPVIAFHDIAGTGQYESRLKRQVEVPKLWKKIREEKLYRNLEILEKGSPMGIGVCLPL